MLCAIVAVIISTGCEDNPEAPAPTDVLLSVRTVSNGNPVADVKLTYNGAELTTDTSGNASVTIKLDTANRHPARDCSNHCRKEVFCFEHGELQYG